MEVAFKQKGKIVFMSISETLTKDRQIVRDLAKRAADIAALPVQKEKREMWSRLNDLNPVRPMVLIFGGGITWSEMDDETLICQAADPYYQWQEMHWRRQLFRWEYLRNDMVIEPFVECPVFINDTGCGWSSEDVTDKIIYSEKYREWPSKSFKPTIHSDDDLERFHLPVISINEEGTREYLEKTKDLYDGIFDVRSTGVSGDGFWAWNSVSLWLGLEQTMTLLSDNPDLVHKVMRRVTDAQLSRMEQYESLGLYSLSSGHQNTGNGGYAYTNDLPSYGSGKTASPGDLWCSAVAEIFTCVSPEMHGEFALNYEMEILKKYGLSYYGCCERLDNKIHILEKIPNLRKISVSAWADPEKAAEKIGNRYVYSYKPDNTAISCDTWDMDETRRTLKNVMDITKRYNCPVEIIMNAVSTLRNDPKRIFEWSEMAQHIAEEYF